MHPTRICALIALAFLCCRSPAQPAPVLHRGEWFLHWGYNRAWFTDSDIHFHGDGYKFTLRHVQASDRPVAFDPGTYFSPTTIWIPQYNYRMGYFLRDRWSLSIGLDHMKYVVNEGQRVRMDGYVDNGRWPDHGVDDGSHEVVLSADVLRYEHTDGLNFVSVDLDHYDPLWQPADTRFALHFTEGLCAGPVIPRSDVRLFGEGLNNRFHLAGYGVAARMGMQLQLFRWVMLMTDVKGGYIDLPDVLTTGNGGDRASQHFAFLEWAWHVGATFDL